MCQRPDHVWALRGVERCAIVVSNETLHPKACALREHEKGLGRQQREPRRLDVLLQLLAALVNDAVGLLRAGKPGTLDRASDPHLDVTMIIDGPVGIQACFSIESGGAYRRVGAFLAKV